MSGAIPVEITSTYFISDTYSTTEFCYADIYPRDTLSVYEVVEIPVSEIPFPAPIKYLVFFRDE